jgi:hypothetical protein
MHKLLTSILFFALTAAAAENLAGKWQLDMATPHGPMTGTLDLQQDGVKLSGTCTTEHFGALPLSGAIDGKKVVLNLQLQGMDFKMLGTLDGNKLSGTSDPEGATWTAVRAKTAAAAHVLLGSVAEIQPSTLQFAVKPDSGPAQRFHVGPETQVLQVPPGEHDLEHGAPARLTDIERGDRVLVSFVDDLADARRIVLVSARDIAKRNETEKLDWQQRGVSGIVASAGPGELVLAGAQKTTIAVTAKTKVRQYAPDSVSFAAALPATFAGIAPGDQVRVRGNRSEDGTRVMAEEIVFGTFLTKVGTIVAIDAAERLVRLQDLVTKSAITVKLSAESQIKLASAPPSQAAAHEPASPGDIAKMLQRMPAGKLEDLKVGGAVLVTATRSAQPDRVTAIMVLANVDGLIQMAQAQAARQGVGVMEAMAAMHGGALSGPNGLSLPAILP